MGRFSNYCNNRFRGAFRHAVNQSIKDYQKNKPYNEDKKIDYSANISDNALIGLWVFVAILFFCIGNYCLFFGGQNKYIFEDGLGILFAIFTPIVDAVLIYFGTLKIFGMISYRKNVKTFAKIIAIILIKRGIIPRFLFSLKKYILFFL